MRLVLTTYLLFHLFGCGSTKNDSAEQNWCKNGNLNSVSNDLNRFMEKSGCSFQFVEFDKEICKLHLLNPLGNRELPISYSSSEPLGPYPYIEWVDSSFVCLSVNRGSTKKLSYFVPLNNVSPITSMNDMVFCHNSLSFAYRLVRAQNANEDYEVILDQYNYRTDSSRYFILNDFDQCATPAACIVEIKKIETGIEIQYLSSEAGVQTRSISN